MRTLRRLLTRVGNFLGSRNEKTSTAINFTKLEKNLQYAITNKNLFHEALSHRSYSQVNSNTQSLSNERLEFLGDAVLNLAVAEYLFQSDTNAREGELTKIRSRLVNRKALNTYARIVNLMDFVLMSPNTLQVLDRGMETILSDALEAIIGAIYLDGGYEQAKLFIQRCLVNALNEGTIKMDDENFKSQLLEQSQASGFGTPRYVTIDELGPDHDRTFTVEVFIGSRSYGTGEGKNKKDAEQAAAEKALQQLSIKGC